MGEGGKGERRGVRGEMEGAGMCLPMALEGRGEWQRQREEEDTERMSQIKTDTVWSINYTLRRGGEMNVRCVNEYFTGTQLNCRETEIILVIISIC